MKAQEMELARSLRKGGWSINQIHRKLGVSKGSVSIWVREVELSPKQLNKLRKKGHKRGVVERRRQTRLKNENARRQIIIDQARSEVKPISFPDLFLIGVALYWAEGSKTKRNMVELSNANPELIQVAMRFFRDVCKVPEAKFRGHIFLHPHLDSQQAEAYWSDITDIPRAQFFKTSMQQSRSAKGKRDTLPYGTFAIVICDTELFLRIHGWIQGVHNTLLSTL